MAPRKPRRRATRPTASKGVKVSAARSASGSASTTVTVEVQPDVVRDEVGTGQVKQVVARIPVEEGGRVRWSEARMPKVADQASPEGSGRKQTFATTHYGKSEAHKLGVRVKLDTDRGQVVARPGAARRVREGDKPDEE